MSAIIAFASSILIARKVGPYVTGQYTYLAWIGSVFTSLFTLGIPNALTKFTAEYSEKKQIQIAHRIGGLLLICTAAIGLIAAVVLSALAFFHFLPKNTHSVYFYLVAIALPLNIMSSSLTGLFKGNNRFSLLMWSNIIASPLIFISLLLILRHHAALGGLIFYYVLTALTSIIACIIVLHGRVEVSFGKIPSDIRKSIFTYILTVSGIVLLDQIVWDRSEVLFLGKYSSPQEVAFYALSYTMTNSAMTLFPGSIVGVLLPHISSLQGSNNTQLISHSYKLASRYVGLIVALIVGAGVALATPFISLLYGQHYSHMIPVFRILLITQGLAAIAGVSAVIFYGSSRQSIILKTGLFLSVVNILCDFIIIPRYGAIGASLANGIAQLGGVATGIYFLAKKGIQFPVLDFIKIIAITIACSSATYILTRLFNWNDLTKIIVCGSIFTLVFSFFIIYSKLIKLSQVPLLNKIFLSASSIIK